MKKVLARKTRLPKQTELSSEYRFDYSKSKPNRFAERMSGGAIAVVLEPDVAAGLQVVENSERSVAFCYLQAQNLTQAKELSAAAAR